MILRNRAPKEVNAVIASGYCLKAEQGGRSEAGLTVTLSAVAGIRIWRGQDDSFLVYKRALEIVKLSP